MKKAVVILSLLLAAAFIFSSCGKVGVPTKTGESTVPEETGTEAMEPVVVDLDDVPGVASGDYIVGKLVYRIDKTAKTLKVLDFDTDYERYKSNDGNIVGEYGISFVRYGAFDSICFHQDGAEYLIYKSVDKLSLAKLSDGSFITSNIVPFPTDFAKIAFGSYVSGELQQYKVDGEGQRVENGSGGYERETFYLFLDIDENTVRLYVGENGVEHGAEPVLSADGYVLSYNASGLSVRVPHGSGSYALRLSFKTDGTISFVNDFERYGDYSASGTFTPVR